MEKIQDIKEAISYLNDGDIITCNGKDLFVMKDKKVYRYFDNNRFVLNLNDFIELYKNNSFYLYEEAIEIDEKKDEEYYRYYRK